MPVADSSAATGMIVRGKPRQEEPIMPCANPSTDASNLPLCSTLIELVKTHAPEEGLFDTAIPGVQFLRVNTPGLCAASVYEPAIYLLVQGEKTVTLGDREIYYRPLTYMITAVDLPVTGTVAAASEDKPFLAVKMAVDPREVADLVLQMGDDLPARKGCCPCALSAAPVDYGILDTMTRLITLLDTPEHAPVLVPLMKREIIYRALVGDMGAQMRNFVKPESHAHRISQVIDHIKQRFKEPLRVAQLAEAVNMSESALYHAFKEVTRMSPVQYQKKLRLHEARKLMLIEGLEASTASYKVGYESPSHFSREYSRMFGAPPRADVEKLRSVDRRRVAAVS